MPRNSPCARTDGSRSHCEWPSSRPSRRLPASTSRSSPRSIATGFLHWPIAERSGYRDPRQRAASSALSLFVIDPPVRLHNRSRRAALRLRAALLFLGGFPRHATSVSSPTPDWACQFWNARASFSGSGRASLARGAGRPWPRFLARLRASDDRLDPPAGHLPSRFRKRARECGSRGYDP